MAVSTRPFAGFEWMIAWRYLRARRAEGGVSVMTWISLIGITLAVMALIVTLAVRAGFREEFVDTILGANAHVTVYTSERVDENGAKLRGFSDYDALASAISEVPGVTRASPLIKGQVMVSDGERTMGAEVFGITPEELKLIPRIGVGADAYGDIDNFGAGIALGSGLARELGITVGDRVRVISAQGVRTAMGSAPRTNAYEVVYIFTAGRYDIDKTRLYMPFAEAQSFFNREGFADEIEVIVDNPDRVEELVLPILNAAGADAMPWTWRDSAGSFLRALDIEDNVMFLILSILVLIASLNIVSGLIMLVKNKGRDIGILRTMGLTEGAVLRIFFICGAFTGVIGTICGFVLGCAIALNVDQVMAFIAFINGGEVWDASVRGIYSLPAKLQMTDVLSAVGLSLGLSFIVTIFPARRAARMNPVEALRYE
ncbi:lipoprotein-releasing ABC transporter permease subunit [Pseudogemmobacter faecipullorum]|uniref:Lipoprotein-releasing ABC transporter permease subunit n=1 Tax=Pseudogemmobacter faecipullorum TaxID=2755041 RepID=A0ABS8CGA1_9RHOB|nr:lipoprotein-releasing ABC transporter permease subunit [Pseudogemmobacter faecipullorum]MCB5408423.1 lipoprotein-releasing ABC transporter permease subunit [Pseudogemmobacter faecipullorum]